MEIKESITKKWLFVYTLLFLTFCPPALAKPLYTWYVFNIPPFGSEYKGGIGYDLVSAYVEAGLKGKIIVANPARWGIDMTDPNNNTFCTSGSWKLPNTNHRVYSDSILNTVDYGVAVRPELYNKLSNNGQTRIVSIVDVINSIKPTKQMLILKGRPVFGEMGRIIEQSRNKKETNIAYMTGSEGPISMLKMAALANRNVDSALIFPEEFPIFSETQAEHPLKYLMLSEGSNFAPIRASCPNTKEGKRIISKINELLNNGLRTAAFNLFQEALPNIKEIREQAVLNQLCIKDNSCKDPLIAD